MLTVLQVTGQESPLPGWMKKMQALSVKRELKKG